MTTGSIYDGNNMASMGGPVLAGIQPLNTMCGNITANVTNSVFRETRGTFHTHDSIFEIRKSVVDLLISHLGEGESLDRSALESIRRGMEIEYQLSGRNHV